MEELPSDELSMEIARQTELCFSDANITKDTFLLKHVKRNKEGFVSLKLLISAYKPLKRLTQDWRQVAYAVKRCSSLLEVNTEETKVRRLTKVPAYDPASPSRTVVATNFPMRSPTIRDVVSLFSACGEIVQVRILRPGNPTSGCVKRYLSHHPEMEGRVCAFVEFESCEVARSARERLEEEGGLEVREYTETGPHQRDTRHRV